MDTKRLAFENRLALNNHAFLSNKVTNMDKNEVDFVLDLSASCTKDQAVMRLLGWGKETINLVRQVIYLAPNGSTEWDKTKGNALEHENLSDFLTEIYHDAREAAAFDIGEKSDAEQVNEPNEAVLEKYIWAEDLIEEARNLLIDIVDELAKGDSSKLRLDNFLSQKHGVQYITIKSLAAWSEGRDTAIRFAPTERTTTSNSSSEGKMKHGKGDRSLYVTLHLLANMYANLKQGKFLLPNGEINVIQLSTDIQTFADAKCGEKYKDQSKDSIKKRLDEAKKYWREDQVKKNKMAN